MASRKAMQAWRKAMPAMLLVLTYAVITPGALAGAGPAAGELRMRELAELAERSNPDARARLLAEAPAFTEGAPYALHIGYLRLLRRIHSDAGQLADAYAVDERIIRLAGERQDGLQLALASLG
ncbi:MAG: GGDEF domain-containing protein, partial [Lysobacteraceae bacterium]